MLITISRDRNESEEDFKKRIEMTSLTMENSHHFTEGYLSKELVAATFNIYEEEE